MKVFIIGITGGIGRRLGDKLGVAADEVLGLVRTAEQQADSWLAE